jgi:hypothetical protein
MACKHKSNCEKRLASSLGRRRVDWREEVHESDLGKGDIVRIRGVCQVKQFLCIRAR